MEYAYNPISSLFMNILIIVASFLFWKYWLKIIFIKQKYLSLYEIHKLEEELNERNMTLETLDKIYLKVTKRKSETLKEIDEFYAEHKDKKAK